MFGKKRREIERLTAELSTVKGSSTYALAQAIENDVERFLDDADFVRLQEAAIAERHRQLREEAVHAKIGQLVKKAIQEQKAEINKEAQEEASARAEEAVAEFHKNEAEAYRLQTRERLAQVRAVGMVATAKDRIRREEESKLMRAAPQEPGAVPAREVLKQRAAELRKKTSASEILPFELLEDGDLITLAFVMQGNGREPLTEYDGWSSVYRTDLEERKISFRLLDKTSGVFTVAQDTWFSKEKQEPGALRGGKQVILRAINPETSEPEGILIKAEPVLMEAVDGQQIEQEALDLWWVNLGSFRALS